MDTIIWGKGGGTRKLLELVQHLNADIVSMDVQALSQALQMECKGK